MGLKEDYYVKVIPRKDALRIVVEKHYLHRECSALYQYGLFNKENNLMGVCIFGMPPSPTLCSSICGEDEKENVCELSRLWVDDNVPKNGESFLVSQSLNLLPYEIVVSFADSGMGHVGLIYQATNWLYTGMSSPSNFYKLDGFNGHFRHIADKYGGVSKMKEQLKDFLIKQEITPKHRYIFFNCDKRRKRELIKKLKLKVLMYPKEDKPCPHIEYKKEQQTLC